MDISTLYMWIYTFHESKLNFFDSPNSTFISSLCNSCLLSYFSVDKTQYKNNYYYCNWREIKWKYSYANSNTIHNYSFKLSCPPQLSSYKILEATLKTSLKGFILPLLHHQLFIVISKSSLLSISKGATLKGQYSVMMGGCINIHKSFVGSESSLRHNNSKLYVYSTWERISAVGQTRNSPWSMWRKGHDGYIGYCRKTTRNFLVVG